MTGQESGPEPVGPRSGRSRWVVACDLDRTLIYSRGAAGLGGGPPTPTPDLVTAEHLDGAPASFLTARAQLLLGELADAATFVPVTTRTLAQYRRIDLGVPIRYAVAANGGHLLVDGQPDGGWARAVRARLLRGGRQLAEVVGRAQALADPTWARVVRTADDLFVYVVAHDRAGIPDLAELSAWLAAGGWTLSVQGRKVYLVPAALTKTAAVAEVRRRCGDPPLAAAGDSLLDCGMLQAADAAVRPAHGELEQQGWTAPGLDVVPAAGVAGGEAVLARLLEIVSTSLPAQQHEPFARRPSRM